MALVKAAPYVAGAAIAGGIGFKIVDSKTHIGADLKNLGRLVKGLKVLKLGKYQGDYTVADVWADSCSKWANNTFVIFEHRRLTFNDMDMFSNQLAHWILGKGIKKGDVVALVMENKPEFIGWWLALTKIGAQCGMVNYNVKAKGLVHCIKAAGSKAVIFDTDTEENMFDVEADLEGLQFFYWGKDSKKPFKALSAVDHDQLLSFPRDGSSFHALRKGLKMSDNFGFIYTSGTTGLPKAANIMHVKFISMGSLPLMSGLGPTDRLYTCLPIFHSAGGGIGVAGCILTGAALVLSKKFSNSRFWHEVVNYECTAIQYIGELGRYLVNYHKEHPELTPLIRKHKVNVAIGNGLRPEVWDDFQDGLGIPLVVEFYGATEGNGILLNFCERANKAARGAVGRMGSLMKVVIKAKIVKFDVETEECVRGPDGFCINTAPGEAGELIFFNDVTDPSKHFKGYTDPKATAKKILSDVFTKGDSWFRTGDLLSTDSEGYYYFVDRIGDTFRWKGENCSTMEVSEVVSTFPGVTEANVYGVKVPGIEDGRACMVAVSAPEDMQSPENLEKLQKLCQKELPSYAQPLFLRFLPEMEITGTFKHQKVQLRDHGCDPSKVSDKMFWLNGASKKYEPFGADQYQQLGNGKSKL